MTGGTFTPKIDIITQRQMPLHHRRTADLTNLHRISCRISMKIDTNVHQLEFYPNPPFLIHLNSRLWEPSLKRHHLVH